VVSSKAETKGDLEGVAKDAHGLACVAADLNGAGI
jgi:hypothetical protein